MTKHLIIISGASSGIGAALAEVAAADGAAVATLSRRPGPGRHLAVDLAEVDRWPDVLQWMDDRIADAVDGGADRVSFVHNAGTLEPIGFAGQVDQEAYTANVLVNAASGQVLGAGFLSIMNRRGLPGTLIMVSSGAGKQPISGWSAYCSAKAALDMWVQVAGMEQEAIGSSVVVGAVAPGVVDTDMQAAIRTSDDDRFPDVGLFRDLHEQGALRSPMDAARLYWSACTSGRLAQGAVTSIDSF